MKFILCPDSFKDSLSSLAICNIMSERIAHHFPDAQIIPIPISDGGEGFCECLTNVLNGELCTTIIHNACGELISAQLGLYHDTSIIEVAQAIGLADLAQDKRNPLLTSSYGVGELIIHALDKQVKRIIIGLGGSATNDGGIGMLAALGAKFYSNDTILDSYTGADLARITKVDLTHLDTRLDEIELIVACDVQNTLLGSNGATMTFGAQKGANDVMLRQLEQGMYNYAAIIQRDYQINLATIIGGGAAGGLGATLSGLLRAKTISGIELMIQESKLQLHLANTDYVLTGEGRLDLQTLQGKVVNGIAKQCAHTQIPCIVFAGSVMDEQLANIYTSGVSAIFPIVRGVTDLTTALKNADQNLYFTVDNWLRMLKITLHR